MPPRMMMMMLMLTALRIVENNSVDAFSTEIRRTLSLFPNIPAFRDDVRGFEPPANRRRFSSQFCAAANENDDGNSHDDDDDHDDEAKDDANFYRAINKRMKKQEFATSQHEDNTTKGQIKKESKFSVPLPYLVNTGERNDEGSSSFRNQERGLLSDLLDGDDAVAKLRQLWFSERGPVMEAKLYEAEACIGKGTSEDWNRAEEILLVLIGEDATFLEPFVRLSKLYTLRGRFAESHRMCLAIFEQRPWHYVLLETMVVNTMALEHNEDLKSWASKRLPPPSRGEQRLAWVKQAIADSIRLEEEESSIRGGRPLEGEEAEEGGEEAINQWDDWQ